MKTELRERIDQVLVENGYIPRWYFYDRNQKGIRVKVTCGNLTNKKLYLVKDFLKIIEEPLKSISPDIIKVGWSEKNADLTFHKGCCRCCAYSGVTILISKRMKDCIINK